MITSHDSQKQVLEGKNVTLTCNYSGAPDTLHWYRQYPRSAPKFLLFIYESGLMSDNMPQRLTPRINKKTKRVDLEISSAAVTDSAVRLGPQSQETQLHCTKTSSREKCI